MPRRGTGSELQHPRCSGGFMAQASHASQVGSNADVRKYDVYAWHFLDSQEKVPTFSWGGFAPPDPPFKSAAVAASARQVRTLELSRPLSRPPWVGSTWSMVWNVDYRTARSSPTKPTDSGSFFWAPEKKSGICGPGGGSWAKPWPSPDLKVGPKPSFGPALIFKSEQKHQT